MSLFFASTSPKASAMGLRLRSLLLDPEGFSLGLAFHFLPLGNPRL
jgi:hypothetical protein